MRKLLEINNKIPIQIMIFQLIYTTIFGSIAAFVYSNTQSISQAFILHALCNYFQFPKFNYLTNKKLTDTRKNGNIFFYIILI